ncbi:MAG: phospholipase [Actinomycetia bacterium]|nr:phospholipase [Actinomycetes bacterium]
MSGPTAACGDWFLTRDERGNPTSAIDAGRSVAWTEGNAVRVHVHGVEYFGRLLEVLGSLERGDSLYLTDWEGQRDERLAGPGTEIGVLLEQLVRRGVELRGLVWRSHPQRARFSEQDNAALAREVNADGGELLLDERVKRGGSHHQKVLITQRAGDPDGAVAFEGGIDLCHGRRDDARHHGDEQAVELDPRYGSRPPWHDVQLEVAGPAVNDLLTSFWERWDDPTPLDHRNPVRVALRRLSRQPRHAKPLPSPAASPGAKGPHCVQVLRTYPSKRPPFPFAPEGERSIARVYLKAFRRARRLVYIEDQYFWSVDAATALARALAEHADLRVVVVVPRFPDHDGRFTGPASMEARARARRILDKAARDRVAFYDLENDAGTPIYVHAKLCVIDDVWMTVGSDNMNRRSWTHDSELSCAILDTTIDGREPVDPAGLGDRARRLPRDTRLRVWREHLGRTEGDDDDLVDPSAGFAAFARGAAALDAWHTGGGKGPRPPGHARPHRSDAVGPVTRQWARVVVSSTLDPDGRPRSLRRSGDF